MKYLELWIGLLIAVLYIGWAWWMPISALRSRYGESGLTWGILVFGMMIPYGSYFVYWLVRRWRKK